MKINLLAICPILIIVAILIVSPLKSDASTVIRLYVDNCNHNNICEPNLGENFQGCASDCAPPSSTSTPPNSSGGHPGNFSNTDEIQPTVIPSTNEALVTWTTRLQTRGILMWGLTSDYELGTIAEINFDKEHRIKLFELTAGTRYYFKIEATDLNGHKYYAHGQFFTLPSIDKIPPSNVTNIQVELKNDNAGNYILMSWANPIDDDFENVRVVRATGFYSEDPYSGKIVYEGQETSFEDHDLLPDTDYYYTFFSKDVDGNYSSGAVMHIRLTLTDDGKFFNNAGVIPNAPFPQSNYFDLSDLEVIQKDITGQGWHRLLFSGSIISADDRNPLVLMIRKEKLVPGTKYILLSVQDPLQSSHFNSYFIRTLNNPELVEANLPTFEHPGSFSFFITFLNNDRQVIFQTEGQFDIYEPTTVKPFSVFDLIHMWISQIMKWLMGFWGFFFTYLA